MSVRTVDVAKLGVRKTNELLRRVRGRVKLVNPKSAHFLAAGLRSNVQIDVEGSVGYYIGTCIHGPSIHIRGNAGWYAGDNMTDGKMVVEGMSGDGTGQGLYGGLLVVKGDSGVRTGQLMKSGTIIVGGNSGYMTGLYAFGGRIIVCGDLGPSAGESLLGATIYVGREIHSLGKNAVVQKVDGKESERIRRLVRKEGISPPCRFKKVVPRKKRFFKFDIGEG